MLSLTHVVRSIRSARLTSTGVTAILALAIGAFATMFAIVDGVLLKPLPFEDPDALVVLREVDRNRDMGEIRVAPPTLEEWRTRTRSVSAVAGFVEDFATVRGDEGPVRIETALTAPELFTVLGVPLMTGRALSADDNRAGAEPVLVLSADLAVRHYGSARAALDRAIVLDGSSYRVVGVVDDRRMLPAGVSAWLPLAPHLGDGMTARGAHMLFAIARLAPSATPAAVRAELTAINQSIPEYGGGFDAAARLLRDDMSGPYRSALVLLLGFVLVLLLIACANVGNLLLARSLARRRELSIRAALGASRAQLLTLMIGEALVLSLAGAFMGVIIAAWALDAVLTLLPQALPGANRIALDVRVLFAAASAGVVTALVAVAIPAASMLRRDQLLGLNERAGTMTPEGGKLRAALLVFEVALSALLLTGAGLLCRSFLEMRRVDMGFATTRTTFVELSLSEGYSDDDARIAFYDALLARVDALPGVDRAALTHNPPVSGKNMSAPVLIDGVEAPGEPVQIASVTGAYFDVAGIKLLRGRTFTAADGLTAPPVAVIDEEFARRHFPGRDPIGQRARTLFGYPIMKEIVGVVASVRHASPLQSVTPMFYKPFSQEPRAGATLIIQADVPPASLIAAVRGVVATLDRDLAIVSASSAADRLAGTMAEPRFYMNIMVIFAAASLLLALAGFYAVVAHSVGERRREIAVRLALGALPSGVVQLMLRRVLAVALTGILIGSLAGYAVGRVMRTLLFGVGPGDATTYVVVSATLMAVALTAAVAPTRAAARTDPALVLKDA